MRQDYRGDYRRDLGRSWEDREQELMQGRSRWERDYERSRDYGRESGWERPYETSREWSRGGRDYEPSQIASERWSNGVAGPGYGWSQPWGASSGQGYGWSQPWSASSGQQGYGQGPAWNGPSGESREPRAGWSTQSNPWRSGLGEERWSTGEGRLSPMGLRGQGGEGLEDERGFFQRLREFFLEDREVRRLGRGRGPKGWRRSDERIYDDVCEALDRHPEVDAGDITVRVENCEVTLEGTVGSRREKNIAQYCVEEVYCVEDVHNRIKVRREALTSSGLESKRTSSPSDKARRDIVS